MGGTNKSVAVLLMGVAHLGRTRARRSARDNPTLAAISIYEVIRVVHTYREVSLLG
jgi:hypothetical protein